MQLKKSRGGLLLEIRAKTNSGCFEIFEKDGAVVVKIKGKPIEGEANLDILKNFRKILGCEVNLVSGFKSKDKVLLIKNQDESFIKKKLNLK